MEDRYARAVGNGRIYGHDGIEFGAWGEHYFYTHLVLNGYEVVTHPLGPESAPDMALGNGAIEIKSYATQSDVDTKYGGSRVAWERRALGAAESQIRQTIVRWARANDGEDLWDTFSRWLVVYVPYLAEDVNTEPLLYLFPGKGVVPVRTTFAEVGFPPWEGALVKVQGDEALDGRLCHGNHRSSRWNP